MTSLLSKHAMHSSSSTSSPQSEIVGQNGRPEDLCGADLAAMRRHRRLAHHVRRILNPPWSGEPELTADTDAQELHRFLREERAKAAAACGKVPCEPAAFVEWFSALREHGPGQGDPLFPWLAESADYQAMLWFLRQEMAGEAGFDDVVAVAMVRMPARAKMEMAHNLWDEFGRGNPQGVHGHLLERMAQHLDLSCSIEESAWEALALGNLMAGLTIERRAFMAVGALGVIELTAPGRVTCVAQGMRRLGMPAETRRYFDLHATLDIEHSRRWNEEVLHTLVCEEPRTAPLLAHGAWMRLEAGRRCFDRYRQALSFPGG